MMKLKTRIGSWALLPWVAFAETEKPNIVFIMADDLGYGGLSCYGSKTTKTPHLDKLASTGVKCLDFHSNGAVCSPTRAALMTGRYQQRSGVGGVITATSHRDTGLPLKEWTLGEAMKEFGYATALFGKWHLGYPAKFNPIHQGFDEFEGFVSGNVDYHRHIDQEGYFDWWKRDKK
ncbi:sulfatase-like hydrolase/transferase, partial [Akkermansiaceae bacterium]|nr:sulfatase-like hydrolase/transferase [Akkermansiaceae bacterium]